MSLPLSLIILPAYKKMSFYWSVVVEAKAGPAVDSERDAVAVGPGHVSAHSLVA